MAEIMVIFDFDSTIIECDSDNWVLDDTALTQNFYQLLPSMHWNPLMVIFFQLVLQFSTFFLFILGLYFIFPKSCRIG